ncbi:MAG: AEC family transporter [Lachnospiraceae bacterium]|nr:AEC family transporter [Lachnospiraceae bacterium]
MAVQVKLVVKLFLLMGLGTFLRKRNAITEEGKSMLTDLILKVVLPCSILSSFFHASVDTGTEQLFQIFLLSLILQVFSYFSAIFIYGWCDPKHKTVLRYATICSNSGILGTPVATELYGAAGGLLSSMYLLPLRIAMWTIGLSLFTGKKGNKSILQMALHPCVVATLLGLLLMIVPVTVPVLIEETLSTIGAANTFLSLVLVGCTVADMDPKLIRHRDAVYYTVIRLLVIPLLVLLACNFTGTDPFVRNVAVVLTSMPAGATTAILALKYDKDPSFAAACTALSTIVSLVAIPAWYAVLG